MRSPGFLRCAWILVLLGASCASGPRGPGLIRPGAPGDEGARVAPDGLAAASRGEPSAADVAFVRGMIAHHGQALEMARMVPDRSASEPVRRLARRIEVAQQDEMARMERWLSRRGEAQDPVELHDHAVHEADGMLAPEEVEELRGLSGEAFDRALLLGMIRHHEGALSMVVSLLATPGAAQDAEIFSLASEIDGSQRAEISRMRGILAGM